MGLGALRCCLEERILFQQHRSLWCLRAGDEPLLLSSFHPKAPPPDRPWWQVGRQAHGVRQAQHG